MKRKFLTAIIGEAYKLWKARDQIWISAPTGIGKSTFVIDELVEYGVTSGKGRVLLLENRRILKHQVQKKLLERSGAYGCDDIEQDVRDFRGITLATYQELEIHYRDGTLENFLEKRNILYVVFDEAHYILEDSSFRRQTGFWCDIIKVLSCKIRIYMSATIWEFWDFMCWHDKDLQWCSPPMDECAVFPVYDDPSRHFRGDVKKIWFYNIPTEPRKIYPWVYSDFSEIADTVNRDITNDKWLIFISNKEKAKKELLPLLECSYTFLSSDDDSDNSMKELVEGGTFENKVLVATKLLDNGVDIKDSSLHHIVMDVVSETELIQMVGRKRWMGDNDFFNVYLPRKSQEYFTTLLLKKINPTIAMFYKKITWEDVLSDPKCYKFVSTYAVVLNNEIIFNSAAKAKLFEEQKLAKRMVEALQDDALAFYYEQLSWLGLPKVYDPSYDLSLLRQDRMQEQLQEFLLRYENCSLDKEQQTKFCKEFHDIIQYGGVVLAAESGKIPGKNLINRHLSEIGWTIVSKGGKRKGEKTAWILQKL